MWSQADDAADMAEERPRAYRQQPSAQAAEQELRGSAVIVQVQAFALLHGLARMDHHVHMQRDKKLLESSHSGKRTAETRGSEGGMSTDGGRKVVQGKGEGKPDGKGH